MSFIRCTYADHGALILSIFNQAIRETTALYDYKERTLADMQAWFADKDRMSFPVVAWLENGEFAGFATFGTFRARQAYKYTVEHSVYVVPAFQGRGIGRRLLSAIESEAESCGKHVLIGCIDAQNAVSIRLHERAGFVHCGTMRQVGFKFGRWLDAAFYQKVLKTPAQPCDG